MNKIKFNSGGQPLFLEDVKLLQDNQEEAISSLLYALCKGNNVLLQGGEIDVVDDAYIVTGGKAFIGGDIVTWDDFELEESQLDGRLYLCIKEIEGDEREFGDGFHRNCRVNRVVYLSDTNTGAAGYIDLWKSNDFKTALKGVLGYSDSPISWYEQEIHKELIYNGFNVEFYHIPVSGGIQIRLKISSENAAWSDKVKGMICTYPSTLAEQLEGKFSPAIFTGGDGKVYSDIIEWGREGKHLCLLNADGGEVKHTPYGKIESQFVIYYL